MAYQKNQETYLPSHDAAAAAAAAAAGQQLHAGRWASAFVEMRTHADEENPISATPTSSGSSMLSPTKAQANNKPQQQPYISPSSKLLFKKVGAEFIGTFLLMFAAVGSSIMNEKMKGGVTVIGLGLAAGIAAMVLILSLGHISGAHLNPAATIAFATIKEFRWAEVPFYVITQLVASIFASATLKVILNYDGAAGLTLPSGTPLQAFLVEFIITFLLMFVATATSTDSRAVSELASVAVGATVLLNNILASALTGASMNPVRTLGPAVVFNNYKFSWIYIIGPIVGGVTGCGTYTLMRLDHLDGSQVGQGLKDTRLKDDELITSQV